MTQIKAGACETNGRPSVVPLSRWEVFLGSQIWVCLAWPGGHWYVCTGSVLEQVPNLWGGLLGPVYECPGRLRLLGAPLQKMGAAGNLLLWERMLPGLTVMQHQICC